MNINLKKAALIQLGGFYANTAFAMINGFLLVPLYLHYFSVATYGSWLASGNILGLLTLIESGVTIVFTQKLAVAFGENDKIKFSGITASCLVINSCVGLLIFIGALVLVPYFPYWVKAHAADYSNLRWAFIITGASVSMSMVYAALFSIVRAWHNNGFASVVNIVASVAGLLATFFTLINGYGVISIAIGVTLKALINLLGLTWFVIKKWKGYIEVVPRFSMRESARLLKETMPIFFTNAVNTILASSKELIISILFGPAMAAIFALTGKLFAFMVTIINPIVMSSFTALSSFSQDKERFRGAIKELSSMHSFIALLLLCLCLAINNSFICLWVGCEKFGGADLSLALCFSYIFYTRFVLEFNIMNSTGDFKTASIVSMFDVLFRAIALICLVNWMPGVSPVIIPIVDAVGYLCAYSFLYAIMEKKTSDRYEKKISFDFKYFLQACIASAIAFVFLKFLHFNNNIFESVVKALLIVAVIFFIMKNNTIVFYKKFVVRFLPDKYFASVK